MEGWNGNHMLSGIGRTESYVQQAYGDVWNRVFSSKAETFQTVMNRTVRNSSATINTPMDEIFEEAARTYGVDVNLLKAIGKAESNFNAGCTSSAGAMGVMQLMPGTAKALGVTDPYDARQSIMGGAKYIADKIKQYDGNVELALAAYNAGSGNVKKYGGVPPFKETQNYIKKVFKYMGEDIQTGASVQQSNSGTANAKQNLSYRNQVTGFDMKRQQYYVDMMRQQMNLKINGR